jgi:PPP family 3-phenylpropionic acid transporter
MQIKKFQFGALQPEHRSALSLVIVQSIFWFSWAFSCYGTLFLQTNGFSSSQIGVLNSVCSTVSIFAAMLWGYISDLINSIKKTFIISLISSTVVLVLIPVIPTSANIWITLMFIIFPILNLFRCSLATLLDNMTVRLSSSRNLNYGVIRASGSITFSVASLIAVYIISGMGVNYTFWISGLLTIPVFIFSLLLEDPKAPVPVKSQGKKTKVKVDPRELFHNYYYITFLIFIIFLFIPLSAEYSFIIYLMKDIGLKTSDFGNLLAVRAIMEVPFLAFIVNLRRRFRLKNLIMVSCLLMAGECLFNGLLVSNMTGLLIAGAVFGLGNGIFIGTVSLYIYKLAPDNLKATSQTIYTSVCSVSGIVGNFVGGFAYQFLGGRTFYTVLGIIILCSVIFFRVTFIFSHNKYNPADEKN